MELPPDLENKYMEVVYELVDAICESDALLMNKYIDAQEAFKAGYAKGRQDAVNAVFERKIEILTTYLERLNNERRRN